MMDTLGDALPREIKRVQEKKERWAVYAADMEHMQPGSSAGMKITMHVMQVQIDAAVAALASGDVAAMVAAHEALKDYSNED